MSVNYNMINTFIEMKRNNWDQYCAGILDIESKQFLLQFLERWHQCIRDGLIRCELSVDDTLGMIDSLQDFIQCKDCVLYLHLDCWKKKLKTDPQYSKDCCVERNIISDALAIEADLREQ